MKYIRINNFDRFQAYRDGRKITWIKLLIEILEKYDQTGRPKKYFQLPDTAKITFIHLLCLQPKYDKIPYESDKWLKNQLGLQSISLQPLVDAGFIVISDGSVQDRTGSYKNVPEKEIEIEKEKIIISILDHWNLQKNKGRWKTHVKLTPDIRDAIKSVLNKWPIEDIKQAIDNFAMVLQGKDYLWTYDKWGLREFLSRHERDDRSAFQWWRFHPNNFREDDWLTDQARQNRIRKQRNQEAHLRGMEEYANRYRDWILEAEPALLIQRSKDDPRLLYAVKKLRPEIVNEIQTNS